MTNPERVLLIQIFLKNNVENCIDAINIIKRHIVKPVSDARHTQRTLFYVISTNSSPSVLMQRYREIAIHEDVEDILIFPLHPPFAGKGGFINAVTAKAEVAWKRIGQRRETENLRKSEVVSVKRKKDARGKPIMRGRRTRKMTYDSNGKET